MAHSNQIWDKIVLIVIVSYLLYPPVCQNKYGGQTEVYRAPQTPQIMVV